MDKNKLFSGRKEVNIAGKRCILAPTQKIASQLQSLFY